MRYRWTPTIARSGCSRTRPPRHRCGGEKPNPRGHGCVERERESWVSIPQRVSAEANTLVETIVGENRTNVRTCQHALPRYLMHAHTFEHVLRIYCVRTCEQAYYGDCLSPMLAGSQVYPLPGYRSR